MLLAHIADEREALEIGAFLFADFARTWGRLTGTPPEVLMPRFFERRPGRGRRSA